MNKYAQVAVNTVEAFKINPNIAVIETWDQQAAIIFGEEISLNRQGCAKSAFLGLCEEGAIVGIPKGNYTKSILNKEYALKAVEYLRKNNKKISAIGLWRAIGLGGKTHNQQIDVINELFRREMLNL